MKATITKFCILTSESILITYDGNMLHFTFLIHLSVKKCVRIQMLTVVKCILGNRIQILLNIFSVKVAYSLKCTYCRNNKMLFAASPRFKHILWLFYHFILLSFPLQVLLLWLILCALILCLFFCMFPFSAIIYIYIYYNMAASDRRERKLMKT